MSFVQQNLSYVTGLRFDRKKTMKFLEGMSSVKSKTLKFVTFYEGDSPVDACSEREIWSLKRDVCQYSVGTKHMHDKKGFE